MSDGSYFPLQQVGACAWVIASSDGTEWICGGGLIPGSEQSSYRSELGGLLGMASAIHSILLPPDTRPTYIITLCDGLSDL